MAGSFTSAERSHKCHFKRQGPASASGRQRMTQRSVATHPELCFCCITMCVFLCLQNTLETCNHCSKPIMERILRATGKAYHPHCFTCVVCHRSLDGIPFTVDASNHIHCIEDFHK
ncbi:hypothetical protein XENOCAPTIV_023674 [Xenoophorus captivus]|uniref:LIM zinc-binding domain-containing protein n=1 Tax=Xenoophorus captivus TaxID=1517983 RepID=A0ABV0RIV9_9TELE